jgi:hypothetical protein
MLKPGVNSPDARVAVKRVSRLVDRCPLVLTFPSKKLPGAALSGGLDVEPDDDFFVGREPEIKRVTASFSLDGSTVAVEFVVFADSVIYRAETATLYICAPLHE